MDVGTSDHRVRLYVQPGCSSCLRAKEFVATHVPDHELVDIVATVDAVAALERLGVRTVPVVVVGDRHCFAQNIDDVAVFLGIETRREVLAPTTLLDRYDHVLDVATAITGQVPDELFSTRAIDERDRSVGFLSHHVIDIAERFLDGMTTGTWHKAAPDIPGWLRCGADVQVDGLRIRERLTAFTATAAEADFERRIETYYGFPHGHYLLERSVWHSAQHTRQLQDVLSQEGITPIATLDPSQLDGLPLPEGIW